MPCDDAWRDFEKTNCNLFSGLLFSSLKQVAQHGLGSSHGLGHRPLSVTFLYWHRNGRRFLCIQERYQSTYGLRVSDVERSGDIALLKELYKGDSEGVIKLFESHPSLHSITAAISEYIKGFVHLDKLGGRNFLGLYKEVWMKPATNSSKRKAMA